MDLRRACERIVRIEERCDVFGLRCEGVALWPLVRFSLWDQALHPDAERVARERPGAGAGLRRRLAGPVRRLRGARADRARTRLLAGLAPADRLFLARPEDHTDLLEERAVDRHLDPLIEAARETGSALKLEVGGPHDGAARREPATRVPRAWIQPPPRREALPRGTLEEIAAVLREEAPGWRLDRGALDDRLDAIRAGERFFDALLARVRPRAAFSVCFHTNLGMGLTRACRSRGLPSVDVQHGKQGIYSGIYSHWSRVPEGGWDLLPQVFWVWGEESRENLEKWFPPEAGAHRAVVGGHRWVGWWQEDRVGAAADLPADLSARIARAERTVLVSLQPFDDPLSPLLERAVRESPEGWLWLFRLHPHQRSRIDEIRARLHALGAARVEVDGTTRAALYALLRAADHHVTRWSSVCFEALCFGVPTTLVDPDGLQLFERFVRNGTFAYVDEVAGLLRSVEATRPARATAPGHAYIETSRERALRALDEIEGSTVRAC